MNKSELIKAIAEKASLSQSDASKALDAFLGAIKDSLKSGDAVQLVGLGPLR